MDKQEPVAMERWPGFTEQSWAQRFAELDRRYDRLGEQMRTALIDLSARANRHADDGLVAAARKEAAMLREIAQSQARGIDWQANLTAAAEWFDKLATTLRAQSDAEVEREAVCKWLRGLGYQAIMPGAYYADAIERGEHRKDGV